MVQVSDNKGHCKDFLVIGLIIGVIGVGGKVQVGDNRSHCKDIWMIGLIIGVGGTVQAMVQVGDNRRHCRDSVDRADFRCWRQTTGYGTGG